MPRARQELPRRQRSSEDERQWSIHGEDGGGGGEGEGKVSVRARHGSASAEPHRSPPASPQHLYPGGVTFMEWGHAALSLSLSRSRSLAYVLGCCGGSVFTSSL